MEGYVLGYSVCWIKFFSTFGFSSLFRSLQGLLFNGVLSLLLAFVVAKNLTTELSALTLFIEAVISGAIIGLPVWLILDLAAWLGEFIESARGASVSKFYLPTAASEYSGSFSYLLREYFRSLYLGAGLLALLCFNALNSRFSFENCINFSTLVLEIAQILSNTMTLVIPFACVYLLIDLALLSSFGLIRNLSLFVGGFQLKTFSMYGLLVICLAQGLELYLVEAFARLSSGVSGRILSLLGG